DLIGVFFDQDACEPIDGSHRRPHVVRYGIRETLQLFRSLAKFSYVAAGYDEMSRAENIIRERGRGPGNDPAFAAFGEPMPLALDSGLLAVEKLLGAFPVFDIFP